jgi:DNA polymerase I-like protein with 3'-5' exonuclease and polymerase domains
MLSLAESLEFHNLDSKQDYIANTYWAKGIDTTEVPWSELEEYNLSDLQNTLDLYNAQIKYLEDFPKLKRLIELDCYDLKVLEEMEWNGLIYDIEESNRLSKECEVRIRDIYERLSTLVGRSDINWNSPDQVSSILYGGIISFCKKEYRPFVYKNGTEKLKLRNVVEEVTFERLVEPLPDTELETKKSGAKWQTGAPVLSRLKARGKVKEIVELLVEASDLEKMNGTYYKGLPALISEMDWPDGMIHGQLNQCVAVTGRLSSSKPNMQNNPPEIDLLFRSRYD